MQLRVVGGLAGLNQYKRHEAPFWTQRLAQLSNGRYTAQIVPFDQAGIRGQELLTLVRIGAVPFGTMLVSIASPKDAELAAPDLAGLNPDAQSVRKAVAAFRPRLAALLRERHDAELLAVYAYPAQELFCARPIAGLAGVKGLRVRTSSVSQSDWVEALGGTPMTTPFAELVPNLRAGNVDCAITGTMSGNTIGLHELTTHMHTMAINWGPGGIRRARSYVARPARRPARVAAARAAGAGSGDLGGGDPGNGRRHRLQHRRRGLQGWQARPHAGHSPGCGRRRPAARDPDDGGVASLGCPVR